MKNKLFLIVLSMLFFGYLGYSSNQSNSEVVNEFTNGFYQKNNNPSGTFLVLMIILIGCYVFRDSLKSITGMSSNNGENKQSHGSEETPSESNAQPSEGEVNSEETPSVEEQSSNELINLNKSSDNEGDFEAKLKDRYLE